MVSVGEYPVAPGQGLHTHGVLSSLYLVISVSNSQTVTRIQIVCVRAREGFRSGGRGGRGESRGEEGRGRKRQA